MKRIGVLSDTHIPSKAKELPKVMMDSFKGVERIFHAGDINAEYVIYELQEIAPVEAIAGNTDDSHMREVYGRKRIVEVGGYRIGLIHGDGGSGTTLDHVKKSFKDEHVHCVVFGHTHIPFCEVMEEVLYFNPGSPTNKKSQKFFSYGILHLKETGIQGEIKYF